MAKPSKKSPPTDKIGTGSVKPAPKPSAPTTSTPTTPFSFWQNTRLQAIIIAAISCLLYVNTLTHDYCQDDAIVITDNMFTTQGVAGIPGILGYDTFYGYFKEAGKANLVAGGRYRPFTLLMFAFEYQIFGKNPFIGHFINVLLFALTSVMLYFLLLKLLKIRFEANGKHATNEPVPIQSVGGGWSASAIAFFTALLFATHPLHTEAVANIKGRDEIMTLLGSLSAVWFSIKYFEKQQIKYSILSGLSFLIALLSKENAITFVILTPLIYWFFIKTNFISTLKPSLPLLVATVIFLLMRTNAIGNQFGGVQMELMNNPFLKLVGTQYVPFSFGEKAATILFTLGKYIQLLFFPYELTHDYYPRHIGIMSLSDMPVVLSIVAYAALFYLILRGWRSRGLISFSILFFIITLSIVSNIVFPVGTNMAERFMFMPSVGFCLAVVVVAARLLRGSVFPIALSLAAVLFSIKTIVRNGDWKDNFTIFTTDVNVSQNSAKLQCSAGGTLIEKYSKDPNEALRQSKLNEAIGHLKKALEIHPLYHNPHLLLGNAYFYLNDFDNAVSSYENALKLKPDFKDAQNNIALTYREGGKYFGQQKNDMPKSIHYLEKAVAANPTDGEAWSYLGTAYGISGRTNDCIAALEKALSLRFNKTDAMNLGTAYRTIGNITKANEWIEKSGK